MTSAASTRLNPAASRDRSPSRERHQARAQRGEDLGDREFLHCRGRPARDGGVGACIDVAERRRVVESSPRPRPAFRTTVHRTATGRRNARSDGSAERRSSAKAGCLRLCGDRIGGACVADRIRQSSDEIGRQGRRIAGASAIQSLVACCSPASTPASGPGNGSSAARVRVGHDLGERAIRVDIAVCRDENGRHLRREATQHRRNERFAVVQDPALVDTAHARTAAAGEHQPGDL